MSIYNRVNYDGIPTKSRRTTFEQPQNTTYDRAIELSKIQKEQDEIKQALQTIMLQEENLRAIELSRIQTERAEILEALRIQKEQLDNQRAIENVGIQPTSEAELTRAIELSKIQKERDGILRELVRLRAVPAQTTPDLDYESDSDTDMENDEAPKSRKAIVDKIVEDNQKKQDMLIRIERLYAKKGLIMHIGLRMYSLGQLIEHYNKHNT